MASSLDSLLVLRSDLYTLELVVVNEISLHEGIVPASHTEDCSLAATPAGLLAHHRS